MCELWAWLYLTAHADEPDACHYASLISGNPDATYGEGFRAAHAAMCSLPAGRVNPFVGLLLHLKKFHQLPAVTAAGRAQSRLAIGLK